MNWRRSMPDDDSRSSAILVIRASEASRRSSGVLMSTYPRGGVQGSWERQRRPGRPRILHREPPRQRPTVELRALDGYFRGTVHRVPPCGGRVQLSILAINFGYAVFGVVLMFLSYRVIDKLTPEVDFPEELRKGNIAVAIFIAAIFVSIAIIIGNSLN